MNVILTTEDTKQTEYSAVDVLTRAFEDDPAARWMFPDYANYRWCFPAFIRAFAGKAFGHETVYQAPGSVGAALWLRPHVHPDELAIAQVIDATMPEAKAEEVFALIVEMECYHPNVSHWYLPMIGVDPAYRGRGVGTRLMRRALEACDQERTLAYLEATSEASCRFYERFGFRAIGTIQVASSPTLYPMVREPQPGTVTAQR